ncbi:helix-turn-helix transcriptional regulator [Streptomyces sp. NPDC001068]|uniref:helix-turn-helix transcriptional regulator n=1 Tax=Streptomyces sp. NPDC001068 TaxID=3364544 RepID=UPI0036C49C0A
MSEPRLRGRDRELAALRAALDSVRGGRGACVVVEGAAGAGKSRLLAELEKTARHLGFDVVSVHADEPDQYGAGAALQTALRSPDAPGRTPVLSDDQRLQLLDSVTDTLEDRAQRAPVIVLADDVQWADPATLFALRTLPGRLAAAPILWVLAVRPESKRPVAARMREDLDRLGARRLTLGPLSQRELQHVVADVLGATLSPDLAGLLRTVAGNPFQAIELARAFTDTGAVAVQGGVAGLLRHDIPVGLRQNVTARLARLPEDAVRLLQIGSVLGREFDLGTAGRMLGRPVGSLLAGLEAALEAELLLGDGPRLVFRHDLIRQVVYENLPQAARTALHREAAGILRGVCGPPSEVAWHVVMAGGPVGDGADTTLYTAVRELSSTAPDAAADLAQRIAGLLPPHDPGRVTLLTEAAEYLGRTRRVREALDLVDSTLSDRLDPPQEASLRLAAAEIHQAAGDDAAAMTHLRQALDLPALPSDLRVLLLKTKATGYIYLGDVAAAEETDTGLVEAAYRSGDPALIVSAELFRSQTSFYRGHTVRALGLAEQAAERAGAERAALHLRPPRIPALWLGTVATSTDRLADTERILGKGQREAEAMGLGWSLPYWHLCRACALFEQGALDDAAVEAESGLTVADELEITRANPQARALLTLVEIRRGDLTRAKDHLRAAEGASGTERQPYDPWVSLARASLAYEEGQETASAVLLADGFGGGAVPRLMAVPPTHWQAIARMALHGGDPALARALSRALRDLSEQNEDQRIITAVRAHVDGLLGGAAGELSHAVTAYRNCDRPLALAAACEDLGVLLAGSADPEAAIPCLEEAAELASASGALRDQERIRRRLRQLGVRVGAAPRHVAGPVGWEQLTESERKLVPLVAEGLTNRAVAERLYVSVHTVNTHMKHIFAKLGINTRVELTRLALERGGIAGEAG